MGSDPSKPTILIVEDEAGPRDALKIILRPFYNLHAVDNAQGALRVLNEERVDLVTLDLKLPDRQGMELLQDIRQERHDVEVIIITGYGSLKSAMDGIRFGAAAYLLKPFNVSELIKLINQTVEKKQRLDCLRQFLLKSESLWASEQEAAKAWTALRELYGKLTHQRPGQEAQPGDYSELAPLLSDLLEAKDRELFNHSSRVSFYATLLSKHLNLSTSEKKALALGSFLHDIGMTAMDSRVFSKLQKASDEDLHQLKRHPEIGARIVLPLQLPAEVGQIISYHHECYDGSGYPYGLQGEGLPLLARIVCIAQAFDTLTTDRSGSAPLSIEEASEHMRRDAGTRYDPRLVDLFVRVIGECKGSLPAITTPFRKTPLPES
ncbi:MAG: HD domain-containing phosphohydrolase [Nitrospirales bacterium]